ncbi:PE-PPE domain-containing protein [[Mycobacterium] nativiensis]|uniref:PE-PPE domain-containing protein n=1 Tax=[Mycobacterium] nativiensis TaxID=2855503 RepID=A0ABU5Y2D0_9MYCO|nr:PE-PPE domain-containing protein [Mycolicibacter sp. MYC340]MEB3034380.1 PE-PPE domain-containing protein [Mycolicibacter sp. MYC340]
MRHARSAYLAAAVALIGAGIGLSASAASPSTVQIPGLRLASTGSAHSSLGDGTAFILGGSGLSTPSQGYMDVVDALYLAPHGFTGTTQAVTTPEQLYPFFGPFGGTLDDSVAQGKQILTAQIMEQFQAGALSAEHPAVVFGWSQGAIITAMVQQQLADQGVPSDYVHFVAIGDVTAPNGGLLSRGNLPDDPYLTIPSLGITFSGAGPTDLYQSDVYIHEYDGFADFPQYPINFLSVLNAMMGIAFSHTTYLGLTADQIDNAIQLPTSVADSLTHYYMIPYDGLPLLDPLLLFGSGGKAFYDLLEPVTRILVNLGYGNIEHGWSQGYADVATPIGFLPDAGVLDSLAKELPQAMANAWQQGVSAFFDDLLHPSNSSPAFLEELGRFAETIPGTQLAEFFSTPTTWQDLFETFPPHTGIPPLDVASALLFTLPEVNYNIFMSQLAQGNLLDAIGLPIAVDFGIVPLALLGALL